jgi:hypothetical protein
MKNKVKYSILTITAVISVIYLFLLPILIPVLTVFATLLLLLSILFIFILAGKISIVKNKKNRFFLIKNMKNKYLLFVLLVPMCAWPTYIWGQAGGVMSAPFLEFLTESQTAQTIASFNQQIQQFESMIKKAQDQIDNVIKVKNELQKTYDFYERNYKKLKNVAEGIKDFNLEGFIYFTEQKLDRSLNPADYMLRINNDEYTKFKKAISYDPRSNVSARARYSYRYLANLDPAESLSDLLFWFTAKNENEMKNQMQAMESAHMLDSVALEAINRVLNDSTLVMSDGERLEILLQAQKILADNDLNRENLESVEESLNRKLIQEVINQRKINEINALYAYQNVMIRRWDANKGFSLAKYAKKRTKKAKPVIIDTGVRFVR